MKLRPLGHMPLAFALLIFCLYNGTNAIHQKNKKELQIDLREALDQLLSQTLRNRSNIPIKPLYIREENEVFSSMENLLGKLVHDVAQKKSNDNILYNDLKEFELFSKKIHYLNEKLRTLLEIVDLKTQNKALLKHAAKEILEKFELLRDSPSAEDLILRNFFTVPRNISEVVWEEPSQDKEVRQIKKIHNKSASPTPSNGSFLTITKNNLLSNPITELDNAIIPKQDKLNKMQTSNNISTSSLEKPVSQNQTSIIQERNLGQLNEFFKKFKELTKGNTSQIIKSEVSGLEIEENPPSHEGPPQHTPPLKHDPKILEKNSDMEKESQKETKEEQKETEDLENFLKSINEKKNYNFDFGKININLEDDDPGGDSEEPEKIQGKSSVSEEITDKSNIKSPSFLEMRASKKDSSSLTRKLESKFKERIRDGDDENNNKSEDFNLDKLTKLYGI